MSRPVGSGALDLGVYADPAGTRAYGSLSTRLSDSWSAVAGGQLGLDSWLAWAGARAVW